MKLYVFRGGPKTGKTTLIRRITVNFYRDLNADVSFPDNLKRNIASECAMLDNFLKAVSEGQKPKGRELKAVVMIKKCRIGIFTQGDSPDLIKDAYKFFKENHCEIGIMAAHNAPKHNDCLFEFVCGGNDVNIIDCDSPHKLAKDYKDDDVKCFTQSIIWDINKKTRLFSVNYL